MTKDEFNRNELRNKLEKLGGYIFDVKVKDNNNVNVNVKIVKDVKNKILDVAHVILVRKWKKWKELMSLKHVHEESNFDLMDDIGVRYHIGMSKQKLFTTVSIFYYVY